jgi:hypothetical protein
VIVIDELFGTNPERVLRVLRAIMLSHTPSSWLQSRSVPSTAHLAWLAYAEYRLLFDRSPVGKQLAARQRVAHRHELAAANAEVKMDEKKSISINGEPQPLDVPSASSSAATLQPQISPDWLLDEDAANATPTWPAINPHGFLSHDRLSIAVQELKGVSLPEGFGGYLVAGSLERERFRTQPCVVPATHVVSWKQTFDL